MTAHECLDCRHTWSDNDAPPQPARNLPDTFWTACGSTNTRTT